jgi:hypothetical protein
MKGERSSQSEKEAIFDTGSVLSRALRNGRERVVRNCTATRIAHPGFFTGKIVLTGKVDEAFYENSKGPAIESPPGSSVESS